MNLHRTAHAAPGQVGLAQGTKIDPDVEVAVLQRQRERRRKLLRDGLSPETIALLEWLWLEAGCRPGPISVSDRDIADDYVSHERTVRTKLENAEAKGYVRVIERGKSRGHKSRVFVNDPDRVALASLRLHSGHREPLLAGMNNMFDPVDPAEESPHQHAHQRAHQHAHVDEGFERDGTLYPRARGNEVMSNERNDKALSFKKENPSPSSSAHSSHCAHSLEVLLAKNSDEREAVGNEIVCYAAELLDRLKSAKGMVRSMCLLASYLRFVSDIVCEADILGAIESATQPGKDVITNSPGKLFVGKLKRLIFDCRNELDALPLFAGMNLLRITRSRDVEFPSVPRLRNAMRPFMDMPLRDEWFEQI